MASAFDPITYTSKEHRWALLYDVRNNFVLRDDDLRPSLWGVLVACTREHGFARALKHHPWVSSDRAELLIERTQELSEAAVAAWKAYEAT